jgi:uncharacterized protein YjiS (DUF1127 family)
MNFSFIRRYLQERRTYAQVVRELSSCTDRELRELGFERADIYDIARQQAARG